MYICYTIRRRGVFLENLDIKNMNTLIKTLAKESKIINSVKEQTFYAVIKIVDQIIKAEKENDSSMTYERQCKMEASLKVDVTINLIKSVANYLVDSDSIEVIKTNVNKMGVEVIASVIRDGKTFSFETEMIFAGGYNIQRLHVRYIVKTELAKKGLGTKAVEQRVSKIERLKENVLIHRHYFSRCESAMFEAQICGDVDAEKRHLSDMKGAQKNIDKYIGKIKEELSK